MPKKPSALRGQSHGPMGPKLGQVESFYGCLYIYIYLYIYVYIYIRNATYIYNQLYTYVLYMYYICIIYTLHFQRPPY